MKTIFITGATSGIGRATALALSHPDHRLVLIGRREDRLKEVASQCIHAVAVPLDVSDTGSVAGLKDLMGDASAVALVNNAGIGEFGPFHEQSWASISSQISVNLLGAMACVHALLPQMISLGSGQIVQVTSIVSDRHRFAHAEAYTAGKAGLSGFTRSLRESVRGAGIRVTEIIPGAVDTEIWGEHSPPRSEMLTAEHVAQAIAFVINAPEGQVIEEMLLTPPKGIL